MDDFTADSHNDHFLQQMRGPSDEERRGYALQMAVTLHAGSGEKGWELPASTLVSANRFVIWLETGEVPT